MLRLASMMTTAALLLSWDVSGVTRLKPPVTHPQIPADENLPVLPDMSQTGDQSKATPADAIDKEKTQPAAPSKTTNGPLQPGSRLTLIRDVSGEFARAVTSIPGGKSGLHIKAGSAGPTPDGKDTIRIVSGSANSVLNPGDKAQITSLGFKDREIVVDLNGGGRGKTRLRDRVHMEVGGVPSMTTTDDTPVNKSTGATIFLDFDKPLPDMTSSDLKQYLSGVLDFSKQHSASVQWVDTLPPEIQAAITDKRPIVGMDHEMVLAAMGRPDRKVREKNSDGDEIEDWIYGKPPAKTVFVEFEGDKVTQVKQFPE